VFTRAGKSDSKHRKGGIKENDGGGVFKYDIFEILQEFL
jgi:hypothetical protein